MSHEPTRRTLVLVAGSGRSGTSVMSGILQRLGFRVPQPEVPADATNPRGFAESQWVVDFHAGLLTAANVQVADARPAAWGRAAALGLDTRVATTLRSWLDEQFAHAPDLVVKDPRLSWFVPLWRACAEDLGARVCFVTMLRHPAAVIASKQRWYGGASGESGRAGGWINQTLFTERATRESPRVFVRYDDLLDDWTRVVVRVGRILDLDAVRDAPAAALRRVHDFVDLGLSRSSTDWADTSLPPALRAQAEDVWRLVAPLADAVAPEDPDAVALRLDMLRAAYAERYAEAEALARSSIVAAERDSRTSARPGRMPAPVRTLLRAVPAPVRRRVPAAWRARIAQALRRGDRRPAYS